MKFLQLFPDTLYIVQAGRFRSAVKTAPSAGAQVRYSFAFGSCIFRGWGGTLHRLFGPELLTIPYAADMSPFGKLSHLQPDFFLFVGDFIYIENPIDQGRSVGVYTKRYRRHLADPLLGKFLSTTPSFFMFDDHEIFNDFSGTVFDPSEYDNGIVVAWQSYLGLSNPPPRVPGTFYYNFTRGDTAFFVLDTRSFRNKHTGTMLGSTQFIELQKWLLATNLGFSFRFLVSSVSWSTSNGDDSWTAFRTERNRIFNFMIGNSVNGVVLLSGDLHYAVVSEIIPGLFEFSASPIDAYPFFSVGAGNEPFYPARPRTDRLSGDIDGKELFTRSGHRNIGFFNVDTTSTPATIEGLVLDVTIGSRPKFRVKLTPSNLIISNNQVLKT